MKVIIDTNVFIDSLFHDDKHCLEILNREHKRELSFVISNEMLEEIIKTFFFHAKELEWTLEEFKKPFFMLSRLLRRSMDGNIKTDKKFCKDPKDDMFIQCAIDESIDYVISSDAHLLGLKQEIRNKNGKVVKVLNPYEFVNEHNLYRLRTNINSSRI